MYTAQRSLELRSAWRASGTSPQHPAGRMEMERGNRETDIREKVIACIRYPTVPQARATDAATSTYLPEVCLEPVRPTGRGWRDSSAVKCLPRKCERLSLDVVYSGGYGDPPVILEL